MTREVVPRKKIPGGSEVVNNVTAARAGRPRLWGVRSDYWSGLDWTGSTGAGRTDGHFLRASAALPIMVSPARSVLNIKL